MSASKIFAPENYIVARLKTEGGFQHVKSIASAPNADVALAGAPVGKPVMVVAPYAANNVAEDGMADAVLLEKELVVVVVFNGVASNAAPDEETVDKVVELLHGFPQYDADMTPLRFERYETDYDNRREYVLFFSTKLGRQFTR